MALEDLNSEYTERKAEDHPLANLKPMGDAWNPPKEEEETFDSGHDGLEQAAKALEENRAKAESEPITERKYYDVQSGDPVSDSETISIKRAADDLTRQRDFEGQEVLNAVASEVQAGVDALRGDVQQQPQPVEQQQAPDAPQPQVTADQLPPNIDPEIADAITKSPKLRAALEQEAARIQNVQVETERARAAFLQASQVAAATAANSILGDYPELLGVADLNAALHVMSISNPERHKEISARLARLQQVNNLANQAQAQQAQIQQAQLQHWQQQQDRQFEAMTKDEPAETKKAVHENFMRIARDVYGVSEQELRQVYQTNPIMRSAAFQRMAMDATKYHLAQQSVKDHRANPVPPVHRPGVSEPRPSSDETAARSARDKFMNDPNPRNAAAYLYARRSASR
jgi:hypothetical protein